jgi:predicted nucleotidyltransferase
MAQTRISTTSTLSLDEVIRRLSNQGSVDGIIVIGSAARGELTAVSDYDLAIVFSETPLPLHVGVTNIDGRFADLVFFNTGHLSNILEATEPLADREWAGILVRYLADGNLVYDRAGLLDQARAKVQCGSWLQPIADEDLLGPWNTINYNLQVVRRYLKSDDPLHLMTADMRMSIYGPSDLLFNYFTIRKVHWRGEKEAIRYLNEHDPEYLSLFNQFLIETERHAKFTLYEQLAERTIAPVGKLWRDGDTVMMIDTHEVTPAMERHALDFWEGLLGTR